MTTQRRCWECGTVFTSDFGSFKCNVCHQAEKQADNFAEESRRNREHAEWLMREQARTQALQDRPPPQMLTWFTEEDKNNFVYIPPTSEELQRKNEIKRINQMFSIGVDCSLPVTWALLWMITSGWVTIVTFIAALAIPFYLSEKHKSWQTKNAKYLYQI